MQEMYDYDEGDGNKQSAFIWMRWKSVQSLTEEKSTGEPQCCVQKRGLTNLF